MQSLIQIIKVNELRSGIKDGRPWSMQDAECILLDDKGQPDQVGVLQLPKSLMGANAPERGTYLGSFALAAGMRDRRIEARLTGLQPYDVRKTLVSNQQAAAAAKPPAQV